MSGDYAIFATTPGGPEVLERRAVDPGPPGPGQARIRQTAVGLNFIDVYHRTGLYKWPVERDLIVGSEAAGVVEAVGPEVQQRFALADAAEAHRALEGRRTTGASVLVP